VNAQGTTMQPAGKARSGRRVEYAIETADLSKAYGARRAAVQAVDRVSLGVPAGQVFGLLGPNGAGKTTTIKMLCGLVSPSSGRVRVNGFDVGRERSRAVRQIGAVLEGSRNVYWSLSAWQNLLYFGRLKGLRARQIRPHAEQLLAGLGLWERRHQLVGGFSRGMQQKVAVACALITDPPVVLLDEPTIGLDVEAARTVKDWISALAAQGKTIVLTTHQLAVAQELCDRVAVIRDGRLVADLPTQQLLDRYAEDRYEVRISGDHRDSSLEPVDLPDGAEVVSHQGLTRILLPSRNPDDLHGVLDRLHRARVPLLAVNRLRPDLEEVFVRLMGEDR
jgi:ABC-2 type transport system ATP-binding protein